MKSEVVDQGAPRTNQVLVGTALAAAWAADAPAALLAIAAVLALGLALGDRFIPGYVLWRSLLRPRFGDVHVEDARMPEFAQAMGASGIVAGYALVAAGAPAVGWGLVLALAAAAIFASITGICLGCLTYRLFAKLGGVAPARPETLDLSALGLGSLEAGSTAYVHFGHPLCSDCRTWERRLEDGEEAFVSVNVGDRPDVAARYGIALVPTVLEVDGSGRVVRQMAP